VSSCSCRYVCTIRMAHGCVSLIIMELGQLFARTNLRNSSDTSQQTQNDITKRYPVVLVGYFDC